MREGRTGSVDNGEEAVDVLTGRTKDSRELKDKLGVEKRKQKLGDGDGKAEVLEDTEEGIGL